VITAGVLQLEQTALLLDHLALGFTSFLSLLFRPGLYGEVLGVVGTVDAFSMHELLVAVTSPGTNAA
jgi:hypothetical protein